MKSGLSSFESSARRSISRKPAAHKAGLAVTNGLGYVPEFDDGDYGLGWSIKKPFGSKKSVFNQVFKVAAAPVRIASAVALQTVGLKKIAGQVGGDAISKNLLKSIGQATQTAAGIAGAVIAAPVVAAGVSAAAGAIGTAVTGIVGAAPGIVGSAAAAKSLMGGKQEQAQAAQEAPPVEVDAQAFYDLGVSDAQANRDRRQQENAVANNYYNQGYDDAVTAIRAQQAPAAVAQQDIKQAYSGNSITGTSTARTYIAGRSEPPFIPGASSINESEIGGPLSLRDAPISKAGKSLIPAEMKPYLPYIVGGLSLVILAGVISKSSHA